MAPLSSPDCQRRFPKGEVTPLNNRDSPPPNSRDYLTPGGFCPSHSSPEPVGQSWVLQERKRVRRPSQYLPPFRGTGRVQSREENWTPPPQLREQSPHDPQGPQPPACGICRNTERKGGISTLSPELRAGLLLQALCSTPAPGSHIEVLKLVHVEAAAPHAGLGRPAGGAISPG